MSQTEQAHQNLRNLLHNGRLLINGMPLTGTELSGLIQMEQMLYEKATRLDKAAELADQKKAEQPPKKKE